MNTGSLTRTPDTSHTAYSTREELGCPAWCTLKPEEHDEPRVVSDEDSALVVEVYHRGPRIGHFAMDATSHNAKANEPWARIEIDRGFEFAEADKLRQIAAEAIAAAEWLEAQR